MLDRLTIERMVAKAGDGPILIALSGGGDSVALTHLLRDEFGETRLRALVVDHATREGSAEDAAKAAEFARALDIKVNVRRLYRTPYDRPTHGVLRQCRYEQLCYEARDVGAAVIAVGHTRDDQAETVLLRASRGSSWRGLAAMRPMSRAPIWPYGQNLWLARPMLRLRREALRDVLRARGAEWIEDPANANENFSRVLARNRLADMAAYGLDQMRLAALAERLTPKAEALDRAARDLIDSAVRYDGDCVRIRRAAWDAEREVRQRALSILLAAAGGSLREPLRDPVVALSDRVSAPDFTGATLGGAWLSVERESIVIRRDPGSLLGRAGGPAPMPALSLAYSVATLWDRRVKLTPPSAGWSLTMEQGAPVLARGAERLPLSAAKPQWLLAERVQHLLGVD